MARGDSAPAAVRCAACGAAMAPDPRESEEALARKYAPGGHAAQQEAYVARARFKIAEQGALYLCPACGYQTRVKS